MIKKERKYVSPEVLKSWMDDHHNFMLVDVLPENYYQEKHLPQSVNACVYEMAFLEKINEMNASGAKPIVVYGENSNFLASASAYTKLTDAGFDEVFELEGGIDGWEEKGYALEGNTGKNTRGYSPEILHQEKTLLHVSTGKSKITWTGRNLANFHFGNLLLSDGAIEVKDGIITGGRFTIDMKSITCDDLKDAIYNKMLINHLSSADFFETSKFPIAQFEITNAELLKTTSAGAPNYKITGDLTLKEITHKVEFLAVAGWNNQGVLFTQAAFEIDRTHWNVMYGSGRFFERLGMHLVNDYITLHLFISAE